MNDPVLAVSRSYSNAAEKWKPQASVSAKARMFFAEDKNEISEGGMMAALRKTDTAKFILFAAEHLLSQPIERVGLSQRVG